MYSSINIKRSLLRFQSTTAPTNREWSACGMILVSTVRKMFLYVKFTTSHPQQSPVVSTCTGTDYVNQLNTEMNGNFILLHLVSLGNSFAICLHNLYKRIKWDPKPLSQEVLLRYNQSLHVLHCQHFLSPEGYVG